jgi:hypothetical protein
MEDPVPPSRHLRTVGVDHDDSVEERVQSYVENKPKGKHGEHRYLLTDFGLDPVELRALFENYCVRFDIPPEI